MTLRYTCTVGPLGVALVATSERGVCCVLLGENEQQLVATFASEMPAEPVLRDDVALRDTAAAVGRALAGTGHGDEIALDLRGTAFQLRVWDALRAIPCGSTATYSEIAEAVGAPRAARAVASACAANHIAVLVPCHRVVRSDGSPGGYKWGISRKLALLDAESTGAPPLLP